MLQIRDICKEYRTGSLVQKALDKVSLNLRDNEFVAILGPSGSGRQHFLISLADLTDTTREILSSTEFPQRNIRTETGIHIEITRSGLYFKVTT